MKLKSIVPRTLAAFALCLTAAARAQTESEIIAKARASYPLKTCVVSDEKLESLDDAVPYIHRAPGQAERVVFLCCDGCIDDFKADPAKYLKKLDRAAKTRSSASPQAAQPQLAATAHGPVWLVFGRGPEVCSLPARPMAG